jgi:hypothetical protein
MRAGHEGVGGQAPDVSRMDAIAGVVGTALVAGGIYLIYWLLKAAGPAVGWAIKATYFAVPVLVLTLAAVLFWFRVKARKYYGVSEVGAGILIGVLGTLQATHWKGTTVRSLLEQNELLPIALAIFSAIFIVVRGFDNIREGSKPELKAISPTTDVVPAN